MKRMTVLASVAIIGLLATACMSDEQRAEYQARKKGTVVQITPEIRADIIQQGHDPDEEVCRREDRIGSVRPREICATRAAWAAQTKSSQGYTSDIQRDALQTRAPGAGG